jgi:hypothetical protein
MGSDFYRQLSANTFYFARVFAGNSKGIGYGNTVSFYTLPFPIVIPTTGQILNITQTTASCGGNVISDNKTNDRSGGGEYFSRLSVLTQNTTYYVTA